MALSQPSCAASSRSKSGSVSRSSVDRLSSNSQRRRASEAAPLNELVVAGPLAVVDAANDRLPFVAEAATSALAPNDSPAAYCRASHGLAPASNGSGDPPSSASMMLKSLSDSVRRASPADR